jgi:hypothetical protein
MRRFVDLDQMMAAVPKGEIFAAMHGELQMEYAMRSNPSAAIFVAIDADIHQSSESRIAVRPDAANLLRWGQKSE